MSHLSLEYSFWKIAAIVAITGLALYFLINNIRYGEKKKSTYIMEGLRLAILALLLMTFLEPEWVNVNQNKDKPQLIVAFDDSNSMLTEDVFVDNKVIKREQLTKNLIDSEAMKKLAEKFTLKTVSFSGLNQNKEATNINGLLKSQIEDENYPRAMILIGDGDWNEGGDPLETAVQYRGNVPVFSVGTGSEKFLPDVALTNVQPPVFALINEKVSIPYRIFNHLEKDVKLKVTMEAATGEKVEKTVSVSSGRFTDSNIVWKPERPGTYEFTLSVPVDEEEYIKTNNSTTFKIEVKEEKLKVLVVESWPRWEYRFLRNALMRDPGVEVHTVLYQLNNMKKGAGLGYLPEFPQTKEELSKYDVVFLGDVKIGGGQLTKLNMEMLNGLVNSQGSGLVFMPGHQGNQITFSMVEESEEMLPVVYDKERKGYGLEKESYLFLTYEGKDHHLTMLADRAENNRELWKSLPGYNWCAGVVKAKEGTTTLAVHSQISNKWGRLPLLVTKACGNGYSLFMGTDSAYRWRHGVEDKYHYRFWGQVVRWMSHKRHISADRNIRVFYNPETPKQGDSISLQATIHDNSGQPLNKADVICEVTTPAGAREEFKMTNTDSEWGVYKGGFTTAEPGRYKVVVKAPKSKLKHEIDIDVKQEGFETVGQPGKFNVLKEIASLSKGEYIEYNDFDSIVEKIESLPKPAIREKRYRLWNQTWWAGLILLLLTIHWSVSKRMGMM